MSETKERVAAYMNGVSNKIREIESDLADVWFDVNIRGLMWREYEHDGRRRVVLDDRPLIEHKFAIRDEYLNAAIELRERAFEQFEKRLSGFEAAKKGDA